MPLPAPVTNALFPVKSKDAAAIFFLIVPKNQDTGIQIYHL